MFLVLHDLHLNLIVETHLVVLHVRVHELAHILAEPGLLPCLNELLTFLSLFMADKVLLLLRVNGQPTILKVLADLRVRPHILHHLRQDRLCVHLEFFLEMVEVNMDSFHQPLGKGDEVIHPFHVRCVPREEFFEIRDDLLGERAQVVRGIG